MIPTQNEGEALKMIERLAKRERAKVKEKKRWRTRKRQRRQQARTENPVSGSNELS